MKVILQGYTGKTGSVVYDYLSKQNIEVLGVDINNDINDYKDVNNIKAIIDFSCVIATKKAIEFGINNSIPLIIGTTSLDNIDFETLNIEAKNKDIGIIIYENFLPSMQSIKAFLSSLDQYFDDITIEETHHESKSDCPSGTALILKRCFNKEKDIQVTSNRVKMYVYEHRIKLVNGEEEIYLTHRCLDKSGYAKGVYEVLLNIDSYKGVIKL